MTEALGWTDAARWEALLELRWHIDARAEQLGWDQPPQLAALHEIQDRGAPGVAALPLPGWADILTFTGDMREALATLCAVYRDLDGAGKRATVLPAAPVVGLMLVHEAWVVRQPAGVRPRLSPLRVEMRLIHLISSTDHAVLSHERDGIVSEFSGQHAIRGPVVDLLRQLAQGLAR